jgi:hypothetical protein
MDVPERMWKEVAMVYYIILSHRHLLKKIINTSVRRANLWSET